MRFIGNKENLVDKIYQIMQSKEIKGNSFFDFFAIKQETSRIIGNFREVIWIEEKHSNRQNCFFYSQNNFFVIS